MYRYGQRTVHYIATLKGFHNLNFALGSNKTSQHLLGLHDFTPSICITHPDRSVNSPIVSGWNSNIAAIYNWLCQTSEHRFSALLGWKSNYCLKTTTNKHVANSANFLNLISQGFLQFQINTPAPSETNWLHTRNYIASESHILCITHACFLATNLHASTCKQIINYSSGINNALDKLSQLIEHVARGKER